MKRNIQTQRCLLLLTAAFLAFQAGPAHAISYPSKDLFPLPPVLEDSVRFWIQVYAEYDLNEYAIHDTERMGVVYEVVRVDSLDPDRPDQELSRTEKVLIDRKKERYRLFLTELASPETDFENLTGEKKRIHDLFGGSKDPEIYRRAASAIRAQRGQKARFLRGLERSGRYAGFIRQILEARGLPLELAVLPHVESSFNYRAYSTAGAAGIWQFTRPTGRLFLRITCDMDERLDPILSTEAAAKLLQHNYEELGSWPLAITAYNHGLQGMKRAKARLRTSDMGEIATRYTSPYFGFASRNFYCEFLAALHVVEHYREYFGEVNFEAPVRFREYELPNYAKFHALAAHLNLDVNELGEFNPALRTPILSGARHLPRGYRLRVPPDVQGDAILAGAVIRLAEANSSERSLEGPAGSKPVTGEPLDRRTASTTRKAVNASPGKEGISFPSVAVAEAASRQEATPAGPAAGHGLATASNSPDIQLVGNSRPLAGYIRIEPEETLGHYADWLKTSIHKIRQWNRLSGKARIRSGQRIKLVFERITPEQFTSARLEYHRAIEEDFYSTNKVLGTFPHQLKKGESLWYLCEEVYSIPYWLIRRYNPDIDTKPVKSGDVIQIPEVAASGAASRSSSS